MIQCSHCGMSNKPGARFCGNCGAALGGGTTLPLGTAVQGRYAILKLLGQGGMGAVYQATDMHLAGKVVALKELSDAAITDPQAKAAAIAAFHREAQLLAQLDHPNIPKVTDFFTEAGKHYLVMELVPGETLEERLARQGAACGEAEARTWAVQLCDVLAYLHGQNPSIIFRDLKPGNIMLTPQGQIKLIDFGIARLFKPGKAGDTLVIGTPGFAPPEQYGKGQTDARSDVYSLGVVLHSLLTRYDPATTPFALQPVRQFNATISPQMEAVIQKATQLDPALRYQTADQMRAALTGQVAAPTAVIRQPARPWRWAVAAGILLILVAIAVGATALNSARRPAWTPAPATAIAGAPTGVTPVILTPRPAEPTLPPARGVASVVPPTASPSPPTATSMPLTPTAQRPTATLPAPTATSAPPTPTPAPPTATPIPPTRTPTRVPPTPACARPADGQVAAAWERSAVGCAAGPVNVIWAAWQPFERGALMWRSDTQRVIAFYNNGAWAEFPDQWAEGVAVPSRGSPPPGLVAPVRGFGYIWGRRDEVASRLGWALTEEKGFCAAIQTFEAGFIFHSSTVKSCQDDLYNWATHPSFAPLFYRVAGDGTWRAY